VAFYFVFDRYHFQTQRQPQADVDLEVEPEGEVQFESETEFLEVDLFEHQAKKCTRENAGDFSALSLARVRRGRGENSEGCPELLSPTQTNGHASLSVVGELCSLIIIDDVLSELFITNRSPIRSIVGPIGRVRLRFGSMSCISFNGRRQDSLSARGVL